MAKLPLVSYVTAAVMVRLADKGGRVGLVLLALDRLHRADVGGLLVACLMIPHVLAAPAIGALTDWPRRPCLVIAGLAVGFSAALALTATALGHVPLAVSLIVLLLGGCCGPALTGGLSSQVSRLTTPDRLPRVFGIDSLTYNIAGPALTGVVASVAGPTAACLLLAILAGAGAVVTVFLPVRRTDEERPAGRPSLTAGARAIVSNRTLAIVTVASTLGQLGPGALPVVAALAAEAQNHASAAGLMMSGVAVGGLVGSLLWTARPVSVQRSPAVVMLSMCGTGLPLLVTGFSSSLAVLTAAFAVSGFFLGPFVGALFTARDAWSPDEVRAQVFTIGAGLKTTAAAAGAAGIGLLASAPLIIQFVVVGLNPIIVGAVGLIALAVWGSRQTAAQQNRHVSQPARTD
jgi:MFS family permease